MTKNTLQKLIESLIWNPDMSSALKNERIMLKSKSGEIFIGCLVQNFINGDVAWAIAQIDNTDGSSDNIIIRNPVAWKPIVDATLEEVKEMEQEIHAKQPVQVTDEMVYTFNRAAIAKSGGHTVTVATNSEMTEGVSLCQPLNTKAALQAALGGKSKPFEVTDEMVERTAKQMAKDRWVEEDWDDWEYLVPEAKAALQAALGVSHG